MAAQAPTTRRQAYEEARAELRRNVERQKQMVAALMERRPC